MENQGKDNGVSKFGEAMAIMAVAIIVISFCGCVAFKSSEGIIEENRDSDIQIGTVNIEDEGVRDLQAEVNKAMEDGMFNVFMNTDIKMKDSKSKADLMIQNIESNKKSLVVEIYLEDEEEMIYCSDIIPAGSKIEAARLDKELDKGVYSCIAYFNILDPDTTDLINRIGINVQLEIEE